MPPPEPLPEQHLLHRLQQGDAAAFQVLYQQTVRYLTAVCSRYIPNDEDVRDVLQDSYLRAYSALPAGYRTVFNLFVIEGKSHQEIAALLHIKESSSASQLHHAKVLLAARLRRWQQAHDTTQTL